MSRRMLVAAGVLLGAVAPAVRAQDLADLCRRVAQPPVGAWSEYRATGGGRVPFSSMRMAVTGQETRGGVSYIWLEFSAHGITMGDGGDTVSMVNRMLVRGFGPNMSDPVAAVMKLGSAPAMQMPVNAPGGGGPGSPGSSSLKDCTSSKVVGWESVTVPAGTFRALHVQDAEGGGDTWVVPDLPFGVVKSGSWGESGDSGQMVLAAHGMGARSEITETPRPYDPQAFMQLMQRMMQPKDR